MVAFIAVAKEKRLFNVDVLNCLENGDVYENSENVARLGQSQIYTSTPCKE
jgi:hypothetical protein